MLIFLSHALELWAGWVCVGLGCWQGFPAGAVRAAWGWMCPSFGAESLDLAWNLLSRGLVLSSGLDARKGGLLS